MRPRERNFKPSLDRGWRTGPTRAEGQKLVLDDRGWASGKTSGRGRNIFLDFLFIERNQALPLKFRFLTIESAFERLVAGAFWVSRGTPRTS